MRSRRFCLTLRGATPYFLSLTLATAGGVALVRTAAAGPATCEVRVLESDHDAALARVEIFRDVQAQILMTAFHIRTDAVGLAHFAGLRRAARAGKDARVLIDDLFLSLHPDLVRYLTAEGVRIRVHNPVSPVVQAGSLAHRVLKTGQIFTERLHGKMIIRDGRSLITGGRNVGRDYFGAPETGHGMHTDRDVFVRGNSVDDAREIYEKLWQRGKSMPSALPVGTLDPSFVDWEKRLDRALEFAEGFARRYPQFEHPLTPVANVRVLSNLDKRSDPVADLVAGARKSIKVQTPFMSFRPRVKRALVRARREGLPIAIYTDPDTFESAEMLKNLYSSAHHLDRRDFLRKGFEIWEWMQSEDLHGKSLVVDDRHAYIGSDNFTPRSGSLDFEVGIVADDPAFATHVAGLIDGLRSGSERATDANEVRHSLTRRCLSWMLGTFLGPTL